ncbi:MAG: endo-1,4-beta-xylanase [Thermoflavifilum sp.]|nr:endo-1,4-beta-xylanase [Thermoflavifilum sp.]
MNVYTFMGKVRKRGKSFIPYVFVRITNHLTGVYYHDLKGSFLTPLLLFLFVQYHLCMFMFQHVQAQEKYSLRAVSPIPIGVAIGYWPMRHDQQYRYIVFHQFDQVTFENALKNAFIVKANGQLMFSQVDSLQAICQTHGLAVFGHNLCWYQQNSPYLFSLHGDSAAIENFLKTYITNVVSHYKHAIHAWDVVNEAIDDSTGELRINGPAKPGYFYWAKYLGPNYIARAFQYAHQADPQAELFYNDYDLESNPRKLAGVLKLVRTLRAQQVPISGIGTQMHISILTSNRGIDSMFQALAATGLKLRISELDIQVNPHRQQNFVLTPALLQQQAAKAAYVIRSYFTYVPPAQRHDITFWNVGDGDSWIPRYFHKKDYPTLFDTAYHPKPMYDSVYQALLQVRQQSVELSNSP